MSEPEPDVYWWCLKHNRVESDEDVDVAADRRVGPYDSPKAAENWREEFERRNEQWDSEDREWEGEES
jgi:hypothetical protein